MLEKIKLEDQVIIILILEFIEWLEKKYGKEEAGSLCNTIQAHGFFEKRWECSDCIFLDDYEN